MTVVPIVWYMILCDDWGFAPGSPQRINIYGLLSSIRSGAQPPYPLRVGQLCVYLSLTGGRGSGDVEVVCASADTGQVIFATPRHRVTFPADPLAVVGVSFRICDSLFPFPGLYSVQFWYNGTKVEERPLLLR
jgi:hypothetical protein